MPPDPEHERRFALTAALILEYEALVADLRTRRAINAALTADYLAAEMRALTEDYVGCCAGG